MKRNPLSLLLCMMLVLSLALGLCACGGDNAQNDNPASAPNPDDYDIDTSYVVKKNDNGTYYVQVKDYCGNPILNRDNLVAEPVITKKDDAVLIVSGKVNNTINGTWVSFCNVKSGSVAGRSGYLAHSGTNVANLEYLTDAYHVFVRDVYDESLYFKVHTLADAKPVDGQEVIKKHELNGDGDLVVTYQAGDQEKTVVIDMP